MEGSGSLRASGWGSNYSATQTGRRGPPIPRTAPVGPKIAELVELPCGESRPLQEETGWQVAMTTSLWNTEGTVCGARFGPKDARYWRGSVAPDSRTASATSGTRAKRGSVEAL